MKQPRLRDKVADTLRSLFPSRPRRTVVQGFWTGPPLSAIHSACLTSFLNAGHDFILYSYDQLTVPNGVQLKDARSLVAEKELFYFDNAFTGKRDIGPFSDLFRFTLLHEVGGWYCDVDTICLTETLPNGDRVWSSQCDDDIDDAISGGQLFLQKGDPLAAAFLDACRRALNGLSAREALGPHVLTSVITGLGLPKNMGATPAEFFPLRWHEVFKLWLPEFRDEIDARTKDALFLPLYQSFPAYIGIDTSIRPPAGSYLWSVIEKYSPELLRGPEHDAERVRELTRRWLLENEWAGHLMDRDDTHRTWRQVL